MSGQAVCADVHVGLVSLVCLSNFYVICVSVYLVSSECLSSCD